MERCDVLLSATVTSVQPSIHLPVRNTVSDTTDKPLMELRWDICLTARHTEDANFITGLEQLH